MFSPGNGDPFANVPRGSSSYLLIYLFIYFIFPPGKGNPRVAVPRGSSSYLFIYLFILFFPQARGAPVWLSRAAAPAPSTAEGSGLAPPTAGPVTSVNWPKDGTILWVLAVCVCVCVCVCVHIYMHKHTHQEARV